MPKTSASFSIELVPGDPLHPGTGRFDFIKTWSGAIAGASSGTMLSGGDQAAGVAGYVGIESFTGAVDGRAGSFVLQQFGTMDASGADLAYVVTPGSGTGELVGIAGTVTLDVVDGVHEVQFEYTI